MKIIFLDVDGVLNHPYTRETVENGRWPFIVDMKCMTQLKRIIEATDAEIVLSSSWRDADDYKSFLRGKFNLFGIDHWIDQTIVRKDEDRSEEIRSWLRSNPHGNFVVLDDLNLNIDNLVLTSNGGLTEEKADEAISILNKGD
jgi:hypothetical protein